METLSRVLFGWHVLALILAAGLYFSYESCFFQLLHTARWLRAALGSMRPGSGRSGFRALTAALAGSIGTGNIVGVAAAVTVGGPGAVFWMCASALLGMMTVYAENYYAAKFRAGPDAPGPLGYIRRAGSAGGILAAVYALGCALSSLGMGNMIQMNALCASCGELGIPAPIVAAAAGLLIFLVARGGLSFAVRITEKLVPLMTLIFFAASIGVLIVCRERLPGAVMSILDGAFTLRAGAGGASGMLIAMRTGIARGIFTNEAGLGSSAFAYQEAREHSPHELGCMGIFQVFADTIVMCSVTGLCILCAAGPEAGTLDGAALTFYTYRSALGRAGGLSVTLCTALFALGTVIAWCCYGREALIYLLGGRARKAYPFIAALAAALGCLMPLGALFQLGDAFNGLMAVPNVLALFIIARRDKFGPLGRLGNSTGDGLAGAHEISKKG